MPPASPTRHIFLEKRNNESFKKDNIYSPSKSEKSLWKKEKESLIQEEEINSSLKNKKKFTLQEQGKIHPQENRRNPPTRGKSSSQEGHYPSSGSRLEGRNPYSTYRGDIPQEEWILPSGRGGEIPPSISSLYT